MAKRLHYLDPMKRVLKRFIMRLTKISHRKKGLTAAVILINIILLSQIYANIWVYPRTYLGTSNVSGYTRSQIDALIQKYRKNVYTIRIRDRSYKDTLSDVGVVIDTSHVESLLFSPNRKTFPLNVFTFFRSFFITTTIPAPLSFTPQYTQFIDNSVFNFGTGQDDVVFSESDKSLTYVENEDKYRIDEEYFRDLLKTRLSDATDPLYPKLVKVENAKAAAVMDTNDRIKQVFLSPLTVFIDSEEESKTFILTEKELADIANIELSSDQTSVTVDVHVDVLTKYINDHAKQIHYLARGNIVNPIVIESMRGVLTDRFNGHEVDAVTLAIDKGPNTTGSYAQKYIEVDISQQQMYLFNSGKLVKVYRVSTGKDYPTPVGEFKILNKTGLGYSRIYNVWMPWWMGFAYSDQLHAYFGIHELPYALVGGTKIQRPSSFLGAPNTGGCIALDIGAAHDVYAFADVGTSVVIYQ